MLGLILGLFPKAYAQGTSPSGNELMNDYQWEIGINLWPLWKKPALAVLPLVVKRKVDDSAYRFITLIYFTNSKSTISATVPDQQNFVSDFYVGKEWHKSFGKSLIYYGSDLAFSYSSLNASNSLNLDRRQYGYGGGIYLFIYLFGGYKYFITPRLVGSIEISTSVSRNFSKAYDNPLQSPVTSRFWDVRIPELRIVSLSVVL